MPISDEKKLKTIRFIDKDGSVVTVDIDIYKRGKTGIQLAISGKGAGSFG